MNKFCTYASIFCVCLLTMSLSVQAQEWIELDTLTVARADMASAITGDTLFIIGGTVPNGEVTATSNEVLRFDMQNLEWLPPAPSLNYSRSGASAVSFQGNLLVFGGRSDQDSYPTAVELWNPSLDEWQVVGELDIPCIGMRAIVINDRIYFSGGRSLDEEIHSSINLITLYEQDTTYTIDITVQEDTLPSARYYHSMETIGDRLFVFGGFNSWSLDDAYMLDSNGWTTLDVMSSGLNSMGTTVFYIGEQPLIVLSGGQNETEVSGMRYFHVNNLEWSDDFPLIDDLPGARSGHIMESYEDRIFVAGGSYSTSVGQRILLNDMIVYIHPSTDNPEQPSEILPDELKIATSPNPSNGNITISINPVSNDAIDIIVYNILGQPVVSWNRQPHKAATRFSWNGKTEAGNDIPAGMYFMVARQGEFRQTHKFIRLP